jgi:hypothetical protein
MSEQMPERDPPPVRGQVRDDCRDASVELERAVLDEEHDRRGDEHLRDRGDRVGRLL